VFHQTDDLIKGIGFVSIYFANLEDTLDELVRRRSSNDPAPHITKARDSLRFARYALAGNYIEQAGCSAYMAAYHAAKALIAARSGKSPKTHSGPRSEFARIAREEPRISREQVALLGWSYELKNVADYG